MLSLFLGTFVGAPAAEAPARGVLLSRVGTPPEPQFLLRREGHSSALVSQFAAGREAAAAPPPTTSYILLHAAPHDPVMTSSRRDSSEPLLARQQLIVERQLVNHVAVSVHQTSSRLGVPVSQSGVPVHQTSRLGGPVLHHSGRAAFLV
jgi:hypothetical protein